MNLLKETYLLIGKSCFYNSDAVIAPTTTDETLTTISIGVPTEAPESFPENIPTATESSETDSPKNDFVIWIVIFSGIGVTIIVLVVAAIICCKRKKNKKRGIPEAQPLRFRSWY